jgi:hypothetical protein
VRNNQARALERSGTREEKWGGFSLGSSRWKGRAAVAVAVVRSVQDIHLQSFEKLVVGMKFMEW